MSSERTEDPTPRRIREAREEGNIAYSRELNAAAAVLVGTWLLQMLGQRMLSDMRGLLNYSFFNLPVRDVDGSWLRQLITASAYQVGPTVGLFVAGLLFVGVVVSLLQTGFLFAHKKLGFDFNRVNPAQGFKRLFSMQGLVEMLKSLLKIIVIGWVAYGFIRSHLPELMGLTGLGIQPALKTWSSLALSLAGRVGGTYLLLAAADYGYQRWQHMKSLRMTKEEVKEEMKQREGDPHVKSRIRRERMRIARSRMMARVPEADVIITNPTHLAIAVQYDPQEMNAPVVLAKGEYKIAERIVEIAREHDIPVTQNIPLARALFKSVDIDQEIPPDLYLAMAELLAYIYRLEGRHQA